MRAQPQYLPDESVDDALDRELRGLLTTCFTKPQDTVFRHRRYFVEPYPHRWVIRDGRGTIVAHVGVHEKQVEAGGRTYRIGGIAEVCVHPDHRGNGYVRIMLQAVHNRLIKHGFIFALLFGDPRVYGSSGYVQVGNLYYGGGPDGWKQVRGMVRQLSTTAWPTENVHLPGGKF
jgi:predicted N-acetyltransferase YhbS